MSDDTADRARKVAEGVVDGFRKQTSRLWIIGAIAVVIILSFRSCASIEPGQVAVRVNNITGTQDVITRPGVILRLPFGIHNVYVLDASPQTFVMKGDHDTDALHVRELTVRA